MLREITKASGIDVPETTELETALDDIIEREKAAKKEIDIEDAMKLSELNDKAKAEDMRLMGMEKISETKKRKKEKRDGEVGLRPLEFMREKMAKDQELKKEKMELRRQEQKKMQEQHVTLLQQMQLQQVNQSNQNEGCGTCLHAAGSATITNHGDSCRKALEKAVNNVLAIVKKA